MGDCLRSMSGPNFKWRTNRDRNSRALSFRSKHREFVAESGARDLWKPCPGLLSSNRLAR